MRISEQERCAIVRTLVDDVVSGFIALSDDDKAIVASRIADHYRDRPYVTMWAITAANRQKGQL